MHMAIQMPVPMQLHEHMFMHDNNDSNNTSSLRCVDFVNRALDPSSEWVRAAAELEMGAEGEDGVAANVAHFQRLVDSGQLRPAKPPTRSERPRRWGSSFWAPTQAPAHAPSALEMTAHEEQLRDDAACAPARMSAAALAPDQAPTPASVSSVLTPPVLVPVAAQKALPGDVTEAQQSLGQSPAEHIKTVEYT